MVFPVVGGDGKPTGYEVENSLRFAYGDNPKLQRTVSSTGSNKVGTFSIWFKRGAIRNSNNLFLFSAHEDSQNYINVHLTNSSKFQIRAVRSNSQALRYRTNALFRDHSAFYNVVFSLDTAESNGNNAMKLYINGVLQDAYSISTYTQDMEIMFNLISNDIRVGAANDDSEPFDGYISEMHYVDGTVKQATDFGETNDDGVWIPKKYTGSYGTNGFYLEFKQTGTSQNSSGIGADTSGNDNHFAVSNLAAIDVTEDTCTNNFCTWNPLDAHSGQTLSEGNTKNVGANNCRSVNSNFGVSRGKWYFEYKVKVVNAYAVFAVPQNLYPGGTDLFSKNYTTGLYGSNPSIYRNGSNVLSNLNGTTSDDDIIMWAMDLDNNNIYFGKDGQWTDGNGFDQSDFSNATAYALTRDSNDSFVVIATTNGSSGSGYTLEMNWGNPPFSISSGNADANGYGNFEYEPPSGYYSICTKNLAEFG